ncbi:MAG: DoxX family protein [Mesoflavibacter sp.]|nr:DoxX family protein [Mesoflavibacter sp.]
MFKKTISTDISKTTIIIRLMVGAVFLSEGIQKFLFPAIRGAGRFEKMGFSNPDIWGNLVGVCEILCGLLLLFGFFTRVAALGMLINMTVAIIITKIPIAFGESFGPFNLRELSNYGVWNFAHEVRTDLAMWMGSLFLIIKGGGFWSIDKNMYKTK